MNSISWRSPTVPNPPEVNPRAVFERLFGSDEDAGDPAARARNARFEQSILDIVADDTRRLQGGLGATDKRKLDEYFTADPRSGAPGADDGEAGRRKLRCHAFHGEARWHSARISRTMRG